MQKTEKEKAWLRTHWMRAIGCGFNSMFVGMMAISSALLFEDSFFVGVSMLIMSVFWGWIVADIPSIFNHLEEKAVVKSRLIKTRLIYLLSIGMNMKLSFLFGHSQVNSQLFWMITGSLVFGLLAFIFLVKVPKGKDSVHPA